MRHGVHQGALVGQERDNGGRPPRLARVSRRRMLSVGRDEELRGEKSRTCEGRSALHDIDGSAEAGTVRESKKIKREASVSLSCLNVYTRVERAHGGFLGSTAGIPPAVHCTPPDITCISSPLTSATRRANTPAIIPLPPPSLACYRLPPSAVCFHAPSSVGLRRLYAARRCTPLFAAFRR